MANGPVLHRDDPDKEPLVGHIKVTREDWLNVCLLYTSPSPRD